ncbi:MAG: uroporphyrinogen decarboxylase family protein [Mesorhizobium sp.]
MAREPDDTFFKKATRACDGRRADRTPPIWLMLQAGCYLPEHHVMREAAGSMLSLYNSPQYAAASILNIPATRNAPSSFWMLTTR